MFIVDLSSATYSSSFKILVFSVDACKLSFLSLLLFCFLNFSLQNEHDKIRELSQQLAAEKKRSATYKRHLEMIFEHIEEHNQSLSKKIQDIVHNVRELESRDQHHHRQFQLNLPLLILVQNRRQLKMIMITVLACLLFSPCYFHLLWEDHENLKPVHILFLLFLSHCGNVGKIGTKCLLVHPLTIVTFFWKVGCPFSIFVKSLVHFIRSFQFF